jgi:hypothetical protein
VITATVRIPDILDNNTSGLDNLGVLLQLAMCLLGLKKDQIHIVRDPSLGNNITLPSKIHEMATSIVASSKTSKGLFAGEVMRYKTGMIANLVETLAAIKLLRARTGCLKAKPPVRNKDGTYVRVPRLTLEDLKDQMNQALGLKAPNVSPYVNKIVRSILAECVKPRNQHFPGGFIHALKERNKIRSTDGLWNLMGLVPVSVSGYKVQNVFMHKIVHDTNKNPYDVLPMDFERESEPDQLTYQEFRAATKLLCPLIDPSSTKPMKEQISKDPFDICNVHIQDAYKVLEEPVDKLNLAYSILAAYRSKKNETARPVHLLHAKAMVANACIKLPYIDGAGNHYADFKELPNVIRKFFGKLFHKRVEGKKRLASSQDAMDEEVAQIERPLPPPAPILGRKKVKVKKSGELPPSSSR